MRKCLVIVFALAVAGCSCSESKKPAATGTTQSPVAGAPAAGQPAEAPAEQPQAQTELQQREGRVTKALAEQGLKPQYTETLPTQLGSRAECKPVERRRYVIDENEEIYVVVGTYPTADAAKACIASYQQFLGGLWDQYKGDFFQQDRFVIELNPKAPADMKEKARKALDGSLG